MVHDQVDGASAYIAYKTTPSVLGYAEEKTGVMVVVHEAATGVTGYLKTEPPRYILYGK